MNPLLRWSAHQLARALAVPHPTGTPEDEAEFWESLDPDGRWRTKKEEEFLRLPRWQQQWVSELVRSVREIEPRRRSDAHADEEVRDGRD